MFGASDSDIIILSGSAFGTAIFCLTVAMIYRIRLYYSFIGAVLLWFGISGAIKGYEMTNSILSGGSILLLLGIVYLLALIRFFRNTMN